MLHRSDALEQTLAAARADNTHRAYGTAVRAFREAIGPDLPARPDAVALYLAELGRTASRSTVRVHAAAIAALHREAGYESPTTHPHVRRVLAGHARLALPSKQATGIDAPAFEAITATALLPRKRETRHEAEYRALVDTTLIGMMRDALLRRSEASNVVWADFRMEPDGSGRLLIRRSKTDQEGIGSVRFISAGIAEMLITLRIVTGGKTDDPISPIRDRQICRRIAAAAEAAELEGSFSGHSPRIGMAQDLARAGVSLPALMEAGRWKSSAMPAHYIRSVAAGAGAVAQWYGENR